MFENMNPLDKPTAFFEIGVLLLISFILGYVCAYYFSSGRTTKKTITKKKPVKTSANIIDTDDSRNIISEPTSIKAVLTRDRKGNPIAPVKKDSSVKNNTIKE